MKQDGLPFQYRLFFCGLAVFIYLLVFVSWWWFSVSSIYLYCGVIIGFFPYILLGFLDSLKAKNNYLILYVYLFIVWAIMFTVIFLAIVYSDIPFVD